MYTPSLLLIEKPDKVQFSLMWFSIDFYEPLEKIRFRNKYLVLYNSYMEIFYD